MRGASGARLNNPRSLHCQVYLDGDICTILHVQHPTHACLKLWWDCYSAWTGSLQIGAPRVEMFRLRIAIMDVVSTFSAMVEVYCRLEVRMMILKRVYVIHSTCQKQCVVCYSLDRFAYSSYRILIAAINE